MRKVSLLLSLLLSPLLCAGVAHAGSLVVEVCGSWSRTPGPFYPLVAAPLQTVSDCGAGGAGMLIKAPSASVPHGAQATWETTAPSGITITGAYTVGDASVGVGDGAGYFGEFFWDGGRSAPITDNLINAGCCTQSFHSQHFGWLVLCAVKPHCSFAAYLQVQEVLLSAVETQSPSIVPLKALWTQSGWVRGTMPIGYAAADPSGVCSAKVVIGSQTIYGPTYPKQQDTWSQCPDQLWATSFDTRTAQGSDGLGEGTMGVGVIATNAASNTGFVSKFIHVDNETPTVSLSGPTHASSTAGTQYITATASAGPSGVSGISCSVDGSPYAWHAGATAQLPVTGVGSHSANCVAYNNARDASGQLASSRAAGFAMSIQQPTVAGMWFSHVKNPIRCTTRRVRVRIPAQWVTVRRGKQLIKIHLKARTVVRKQLHCHARVVRRRETVVVTVKRHGQKVRVKRVRYVRVVLPPRVVGASSTRVRFGHAAVVTGWLGTSSLAPLGGQTVVILGAPANGVGAFTPVATATTTSSGSWTAVVPAGPSRILEAVYGGSGVTEATASNQVSTAVPARLRVGVSPHRTHWGGTIHIRGQLRGGYIPASGALVLLYIGWQGGSTEIGHLYTDAHGRFSSPYTFLRGNGTERYWIWAESARESDYPYTPSRSGRTIVTVRSG
jgi:hypothetical protein